MPTSIGKYQCKSCDDIFEAKSDDFYTCKCGASEVQPHTSHYSGYSYKNGNAVNVIEGETFHMPEEFIALSEKAQNLYDEIKQIKEQTGYKYHLFEMHENGKNGEKFTSSIHINTNESQNGLSGGVNELTMRINLERKDHPDVHARIEERLERFLGFMKQIETDELKLGSIGAMKKVAEKFDLIEDKEQVEEYHYTYHV